MLVLFSDCWLETTENLTCLMLENSRYTIEILVFDLLLIKDVLAELTRRWQEKQWSRCRHDWSALTFAGIAVFVGAREMITGWPRTFGTVQYLMEGEWGGVADILAQHVTEESDRRLTDRANVAYYSSCPPIFLYTPAERQWLILKDEMDATTALRAGRVKLVVFSNFRSDWWPRTTLYASLQRLGFAQRIWLPRWELFILPRAGEVGEGTP